MAIKDMNELHLRIARVTEDLRTIQQELNCAAMQAPSDPELMEALNSLSETEPLDNLRSALDQMRHFLWFYSQVMSNEPELGDKLRQSMPGKTASDEKPKVESSFLDQLSRADEAMLGGQFAQALRLRHSSNKKNEARPRIDAQFDPARPARTHMKHRPVASVGYRGHAVNLCAEGDCDVAHICTDSQHTICSCDGAPGKVSANSFGQKKIGSQGSDNHRNAQAAGDRNRCVTLRLRPIRQDDVGLETLYMGFDRRSAGNAVQGTRKNWKTWVL